ncbi:MAG: phytanoyl-CoA dioxygenase family protein [bacterium]
MPSPLKNLYARKGYISPIQIIDQNIANAHRTVMEEIESQIGPLHYRAKIHTVMRSPYELATHPKLLDAVEQLLGPDILIYNVTYIVKEPMSLSYVSWHQDLTYWGLDSDDQISAWLALSEASEQSGCMQMIPGSHLQGMKTHDIGINDDNNVLFQSQTVHDIDSASGVMCPLSPGQASLHHGWTLHRSMPNESEDRRIGLNIQYIAPHVRQTKIHGYSALLARGTDRYQHFASESPATSKFDSAALGRNEDMNKLHRAIAANA